MRKVLVCICAALLLLTGCSSSSSSASARPSFYEYLGDYSYDSTSVAFVYEPVSDEDEYGIQYRAVTDMDALLASDNTVCLYFYNSLSSDVYGITAGAEDIAQCTWSDMVFVMIDVLDDTEMATRYEVERVPEFVIVRSGNEISRFEGYNYEVWTMSDVAQWVSSCGVRVDYTKIN